MNVYILDEKPDEIVKQYPDSLLKSCNFSYKELLSTAITLSGGQGICSPLLDMKDPWIKWVSRNDSNWFWFYNLNVALCKELLHRGFETTHAGLEAIMQLDPTKLRGGMITHFPDVVPKECNISPRVFINHRYMLYCYSTQKETYTNRDVPDWWNRDYWLDYFEKRKTGGVIPGK